MNLSEYYNMNRYPQNINDMDFSKDFSVCKYLYDPETFNKSKEVFLTDLHYGNFLLNQLWNHNVKLLKENEILVNSVNDLKIANDKLSLSKHVLTNNCANRKRKITELESAIVNKNYLNNVLQSQLDSEKVVKKKARILNDSLRKFHSSFFNFCKSAKSSDLLVNKTRLNFKLKYLISLWDSLENFPNGLF